MSTESTKRAVWVQPTGKRPELQVNNSLTQSTVPFVTKSGNRIGWYACGPTVYDSAHVGHARAYVTFDIIRRIFSDYFNYDMFFVMNITDVDDKIILRARRNYIIKQYIDNINNLSIDTIINDGFIAYIEETTQHNDEIIRVSEKLKTAESRYKGDLEDKLKQLHVVGARLQQEYKSYISYLLSTKNITLEYTIDDVNTLITDNIDVNTIKTAPKVTITPELDSNIFRKDVLPYIQGVLATYLDHRDGHSVTDNTIFKSHTLRYEREFMDDMSNLGVRQVDALTRVTEYVPPIITFVEKIINNGYAYVSNNSVYFDTHAFMTRIDEASGELKNFYAKLKPTAVGNTELAADGEGALATNNNGIGGIGTNEKKHPNDFALWKKSQKGEPYWPSPWGNGRPGWHIECSAMATDLLGVQFDIHSGGEDLKFPHHDNEIAQSEAYSGVYQWVNYFLHAGHLNIAGLKMSKSLKNFITIKQALQYNTARQIRLLFLFQKWDSTMNYDDESLKAATSKENVLKNFYHALRLIYKQTSSSYDNSIINSIANTYQYWNEHDRALQQSFEKTQDIVHTSLHDNFNYPAAMASIFDLVSDVNKYITYYEQKSTAGSTNTTETTILPDTIKIILLQRIESVITRYLKVFGVISDQHNTYLELYDNAIGGSDGSSSSSVSDNQYVTRIINTWSAFRDDIRNITKTTDINTHQTVATSTIPSQPLKNVILSLCDTIRDDTLLPLGIKLEDRADGHAVWKFDDPNELVKQKNAKIAEIQQKQRRKLQDELKTKSKLFETVSLAYGVQQWLQHDTQFTSEGYPVSLYNKYTNNGQDPNNINQIYNNNDAKEEIIFLQALTHFQQYNMFDKETLLPTVDGNGEALSQAKIKAYKKQQGEWNKALQQLEKIKEQTSSSDNATTDQHRRNVEAIYTVYARLQDIAKELMALPSVE